MSICNLHVDWIFQGSFNLWRLKQLLSWIPLLASVEIVPFGEIYKYDRKTGQVVDGSIPLHTTFNQTLFVRLQMTFSAPAWKVHRGHLVFGSSVRLSVRPFVCPSVRVSVCPFIRYSVPLTKKVQYLKLWWSYSNQTWTVSSYIVCSHFTDIPCPRGWVKM